MEFLTNDKLVIVGAGGMIGSNMVQSALMLGLTPNICLYPSGQDSGAHHYHSWRGAVSRYLSVCRQRDHRGLRSTGWRID